MQFIDLYPLKGTFKPGEEIEFRIDIESEKQSRASVQLSIFHQSIVHPENGCDSDLKDSLFRRCADDGSGVGPSEKRGVWYFGDNR